MEVPSFLNQEDFSHFCSNFFPEMEDGLGVNQTDSRKRRRKSEEQDLRGVIDSLFLFEDAEEKREETQLGFDFRQEKPPIEMAELDDSRARRARRTESSAPAVEASTSGGSHRRLWVKDRSQDWWDQRNSPDFPEEQFKKDFKMSRATFDSICDELDSTVTKKNTMLRDAIPVRQRVAVCVWRLATGEPLREVSKRFGLGISTCHKLVLEVCSAITTVLMPKYIKWPEETVDEVKAGFKAVSGMKSVLGAVYTTHVPIIAPKVNVSAYFNRRHTERNQKTSYSITIQGVVDSRGLFSDICVGFPGSMSDDQVLEKSTLYSRGQLGLLGEGWVVGGPSFPLLEWMLVPYVQPNLGWTKDVFNNKVDAVRRPAREAFARLKSRWASLQKRTEVKLQDLRMVLDACCTLHNICELRGEEIDPECTFEIFDDETAAPETGRAGTAGQRRDQIAHNLLHHNLAGTTFL